MKKTKRQTQRNGRTSAVFVVEAGAQVATRVSIPKKKGVGRKRNAAAVLDEITAYRIGGFYRSDLEAARRNVDRYYKRKFTDADEYNTKVDALRKRIYARAVELLKLKKPI